MALGSTMRALKGHAADETLKVYNRARALLDETIPAKQQMAVLYGAWTVRSVRGDWVSGLEIARQSLALAQSDDDPEAAAFASRMNGIALWLTGSSEEAVPHLERAVRLYAPGSGNVTDLRYSQDHAVWALSVLAPVLWSLGHPDRAAEAAVRSLEWARAINHGMTTGSASPLDRRFGASSGRDRGRAAPMPTRRSNSAWSATSDPISRGRNSIAAWRWCVTQNMATASN